MVYRVIFSLFLLTNFLFAQSDEVEYIKSHYKSLARDFLIYEYAKKKDTPLDDLKILKGEILRYNGPIKKLFDEKLETNNLQLENCKKLEGQAYIDKCIKIFITPKEAEKNLKEVKKFYAKLPKKEKKAFYWFEAMMAKDTFKALQKANPYHYLKLFNELSYNYKHKVLNKQMKHNFVNKLAHTSGFDTFVRYVVMDGTFNHISKSLANVSPENLGFDASFYLGLMSLKQAQNKKALSFFKNAQKVTQKKSLIDKALFWQYQITNDEKILLKLAYSKSFNFYSFLAKEKKSFYDFDILQPKPQKKSVEGFDIKDPFVWAKLNDRFKNMTFEKAKKELQQFYTIDTLPHYTLLMERASGYRKNFFITPYEKYLNDVPIQRKVLIYSLARQESRFVPASVSTSYALGSLQFMPFLIDEIAKEQGINNFKYFDIFDAKNAIYFANKHLDFLEEQLQSPLFIAYAYNGGIGFTKKLFTEKKLFSKGKYEPFLSMELVPYQESRIYAKKVLMNYFIYGRIFGLNLNLNEMLSDLLIFGKAEKIRQ